MTIEIESAVFPEAFIKRVTLPLMVLAPNLLISGTAPNHQIPMIETKRKEG